MREDKNVPQCINGFPPKNANRRVKAIGLTVFGLREHRTSRCGRFSQSSLVLGSHPEHILLALLETGNSARGALGEAVRILLPVVGTATDRSVLDQVAGQFAVAVLARLRPVQRHLVFVHIGHVEVARGTGGNCKGNQQLSNSGRNAIWKVGNKYSTLTTPPEANIRTTNGKTLRQKRA